ncbi:MAG: 23S rRNA (uracil(1939)-C(5))-methyltransferase RlmD [Firmicutes bacterium]|nr:23S rRNA (uracil(1939)-C(5))-methyltransferase RlmD [Bacillota bacterium]
MKDGISRLIDRETTLQIEDLTHSGAGVGRVEGAVVFVPGALPGEEVRVRVRSFRRGIARAELLEIINPSGERRLPECPRVDGCGGCTLQHMDYQAQLAMKTRQVRETLKRIGKLEGVEVKPTRGMEHPWRYRNNGQFHLEAGEDPPAVRIGYYRPGSRELLEVDDCLLMPAPWREFLTIIKNELNTLWRVMASEGRGFPLYHLLLRESFHTRQTALVLVLSDWDEPRWREWIDGFLDRLPPGITLVAENLNPHPERAVLGGKTRVIHGLPRLRERIGDMEFQLSPVSFYQVNPEQTEVLYRQALEYAKPRDADLVFDLYCGTGTISLFLAREAGRVIGVESLREAVKDAGENARLNHIDNARFIHSDVAEYLERYLKSGQPAPSVVVLDPPRAGARPEVLARIAALRPERVVYVSCDPATLARDLRILTDSGFKVREVQPVDMFPQTSHTESVALIRIK